MQVDGDPLRDRSEEREQLEATIVDNPDDQLDLLTSPIRRRLAMELLKGIFEPIVDLQETTQAKILQLLQDPATSMYADAVVQTPEWENGLRYCEESIQDLLEKGRLSVAIMDGCVAGIAGLWSIGVRPSDGREVYEIKHGVVLPEFQGHHLSSLLQKHVAHRVRAKNPEAYLLSYTKSPKRSGSMTRAAAVEITPEEYVDIHRWGSEEQRSRTLQRRLSKQTKGWKTLLLDLQVVRERSDLKKP